MEESHIELIFSRDCITVKTPVVVPIKGKTWHEEKIGYGDIPVGGFRMNVMSIEKQEEADRLVSLLFKVSSFEPARRESQEQGIVTIAPSCLKYYYMNIARYRQLFPGYKVPFTLETDKGEFVTHVSGAPKGSSYGDPKRGSFFSGIKRWYLEHPELRVGSKVLIEVIEPLKRYRLSIHENSSEPQYEPSETPETPERLNVDDKQDLAALSEKLISWAQEKNLKAITRSDVKLFLLDNNIRLGVSTQQVLYRDVKLKYRWVPPWMKSSEV